MILFHRLAPLLFLFAAMTSSAQTLRVPPGLPDWAFNIPDKVQPRGAVRPEGTVKALGSAREYDAAKIAGNANPPDWFPDEHGPAPRSVKGDVGSPWLVVPVT